MVPRVDKSPAFWIVFYGGLVLVVAGLVILLVFVLKRGVRAQRARYVRTRADAGAYGLYPPGRVSADGLPWLRHLPENGQGTITKMFVGERGGRPVAVAEYLYSKPSMYNYGGTGRAYVAAVRLPGPQPPRQGPCRYGEWFTAGTDLALYAEGTLEFPFILGVLDELLGIAA